MSGAIGMIGYGDVPLSWGQRSLWFVQRLAPEATAYNVNLTARARELDPATFVEAWRRLAARHAVLRTTYPAPGGQPVGRIHDHLPIDVSEIDAAGLDEAALERRVGEEARRPFGLERGPIVRLRLFRRASEWVVLLSVHHIAIDFSSLAILVDELGALYRGEELPPLRSEYADFVRWQEATLAGPKGEAMVAAWRSRLAGAPPALLLPTDRPRRPLQTFAGANRLASYGPRLTRGWKELAASEGTTLSTALLAAFQALLHRYSGQQDVLVGCPVPGRGAPEFNEVVGYFINSVVVRSDFAGDPGFRHLLRRVRSRVEEAQSHGDYPFPLLVERLRPRRDAGLPAFFQVFFVLYQGEEERVSRLLTGQSTLDVGGLVLEPYLLGGQAAMFDLSLMMGEAGDTISAGFQYNTDLWDAATIERLAEDFERLLEAVLEDPDQPVSALPASLGAASRPFQPSSSLQSLPSLQSFDRADTRRALLERQKRHRARDLK